MRSASTGALEQITAACAVGNSALWLGTQKETQMTIPLERTRALAHTKEFLEAMLDPKLTPRTPRWMRERAKALLEHYPALSEIEMAHKAPLGEFGHLPSHSRMTTEIPPCDVLDTAKDTKDDFLAHFFDAALFSYALEPDLLTRQMNDYLRRRKETPKLGMVLHGSTLSDSEIDAVLTSTDPHGAGAILIAEKLDRWG